MRPLSSALCGSAPLTALWGAMDDGGPQLQLPLAALMGSGKIIAIARLAFFISRDYISVRRNDTRRKNWK